MSAALRCNRGRAARALASHEWRAQLAWADLAAWPTWADDATQLPALARRVGAVWQAAALRRCIHGPTLKQAQHSLGDATLKTLLDCAPGQLGEAGAADDGLPGPEQLDAWLEQQGAEVLLSALPAPLLRMALRDMHWPKASPLSTQFPAPEMTRAAAAVQLARELGARA